MAGEDSAQDMQDQSQDRGSKALLRGHERLYDAYNELHTLAQSFKKPFDAPAILVVGHQTDGKSALIEALMGFQFNSVGGGTKTRRPIAINMKYNGACSTPSCFLKLEDGITEQALTLTELQAHIDADNAMLESEQQFASREIVVRMEYKHCPNLTIIDTPGLICPAPGKKSCALQASAAQVEEIVRSKAQVPEYVILCLEDCSDWTNATTRRLVMQVDPNLSRTVLVSTKFDTRIPQFARGADCEMFLKPSVIEECSMLGDGPFFTSVPSGRVGSGTDCVFPTNDAFRERLVERENIDIADLEAKLGRRLSKPERDHIGVSALRRFLEQLLQKRYLDAVPVIVPLLDHEQRATQQRLGAIRRDLVGLNPDELKDKGRAFVDAFLNRLQQLLRGTVAAPPDKWGETLSEEHGRGGGFASSHSRSPQLHETVPNSSMRLYGGAQFHRAMTEFRLVVGALPCPDVSHEDIVNACGLDYEGGHDGVNYVRTACVIAVSKAKEILEPFIHQLGSRLAHVLRRLLHISLALMQQHHPADGYIGGASSMAPAMTLTDQFVRRVSTAFHAFLTQVEESCKERCLEDLASTTRYVSWSLHTRNSRNLKQLLGKIRVTSTSDSGTCASAAGSHPLGATAPSTGGKSGGPPTSAVLGREPSISGGGGAGSSVSLNDMLEATLWNRNLTGISEDIVRALVAQMFDGIRDHLVQAAELKFNCFFLMPLVDAFPARLRRDIECAYEEGLDDVFDAASLRSALESRQAELQEELHRVERLQRKFHSIHLTLVHGPSMGTGPTSRAITDLETSVMISTTVSPFQPAQQQQHYGTGGRLAPPALARTPETGPKLILFGASPSAPGTAGRKIVASAAGAAAVAAGAGHSLSLTARALAQQQVLSAPGTVDRDRGERDAKDKTLSLGGMALSEKLAQQQQLAAGAMQLAGN